MVSSKHWLIAGATGGLTAIALGAFGAHILKSQLPERLFNAFSTAVEYQMAHSLLLLVIGLLTILYPGIRLFRLAGAAILLGVLLFSGSLYLLVFSVSRMIAMLTPIGGVILILGWLLLMLGCLWIPEDRTVPHLSPGDDT